jgi:predicted esterase
MKPTLTAAVLLLARLLAAAPDPLGPDAGAQLDIDLDSLNAAATEAYNDGDYHSAAALYLEGLAHDSRNSGGLYNLACCYGLMGRDTLSADCLARAFRAGFRDVGWALMDPDFDPVRSSAYFSSAFDSLAGIVAASDARAGGVFFSRAEYLVPCRVHMPAGADPGRPTDLVIGLHGYGGTAEGFSSLWDRFEDPDFIFICPEAPYAFGGSDIGYSWDTGSATDSLAGPASWQLSADMVRAVIEQARGRFDIGSIYLLGFSQGCSLAYTAGIANSDIVDGIICFAGWLDAGSLPSGALDRLGGFGAFIVHGANDRVVEMEASTGARDILEASGCEVVFSTFEGGHAVPDSMLVRAQEWMEGRE